MTQIQFDFLVGHSGQFLTGPHLILRPAQQTGVFGDSHRSFFPVPGDHDDLYAGFMDFSDCLHRFGPYFVPDGQNTCQDQPFRGKFRTVNGTGKCTQRQHPDRPACQFQHPVLQHLFHHHGQRQAPPFRIPVKIAPGQQRFRRALNQRIFPDSLHTGKGVFTGTVKRYKRIPERHRPFPVTADIPGQSPFRNIPTDNRAFRHGGRCVQHHILVSHFPDGYRQPVKGIIFLQIAGNKVHHFQFPFGNGTCFIRKQQV